MFLGNRALVTLLWLEWASILAEWWELPKAVPGRDIPARVRAWTCDQVQAWAGTVLGLSPGDLQALAAMGVTGLVLPSLTSGWMVDAGLSPGGAAQVLAAFQVRTTSSGRMWLLPCSPRSPHRTCLTRCVVSNGLVVWCGVP